MPVYRVLRKPHHTVNGPVPVGGTVELPAAAGDAVPHNLARVTPAAAQPPLPEADQPALADLLPEEVADLLIDNGLDTLPAVQAASDETLRGIKGIGPATLRTIREATS